MRLPGLSGERGNPALRALDRYVGIPIVALGGALKPKRPRPPEPQRIGVLNATSIGDTVLLSAVVRDIATAHPQAETILFAAEAMEPVLRQLDGVSVVPIRISSPRSALRAIRAERLDTVLDFDPWPRIEPLYCLLSGASFAAGFRSAGQHRHYAYDASVEWRDTLHALDNHRRLAEVIGVASTSMPSLRSPGVVQDLPPAPYAVFHLWPTGVHSDLKEWPAERWRALARTLAARGYRIALSGAPGDTERTREFAASLPDLAGQLLDLAGKYDLRELLDVLSGSRCVVSVNTGVMHLAAAVGAPTVALNGPTSERRWGPVGKRAVSVSSSLPGCGYLNFGWEYRGQRADCMLGVPVDAVLEAVERVASP